MFVTGYMTKRPVTVSPETLIQKARQILKEKGFRHLPVTSSEGKLLGMVTDRDIRSAYPSSVLDEKERVRILEKVYRSPVGSIMSTDLSSLNLNSTLDDALILLEKQNVGALPVVDDDHVVVGIFSVRDLMRAYGELFGLYEKGSSLISIIEEGQGAMNRAIKVLEAASIPFTRVIRALHPLDDDRVHPVIHMRVQTMNLPSVKKALSEAGLKVL